MRALAIWQRFPSLAKPARVRRGRVVTGGLSVLLRIIVTGLLLPPVVFLLPLLAGMLMLSGRLRRLALGVGLSGLLLTSIPLVPSLLFLALEHGIAFKMAPKGDPSAPGAIVILGGTFSNGRNEGDLSPGVQPGALTVQRVRAGVALQRLTGLPMLVTGGGASEATAIGTLMSSMMQSDFHAPPRWVERKAADTWENALFGAQMLRQDGINSVYLVTSAWHMRRALIAFGHAGLTVWPAPDSLQNIPGSSLTDYIPSPNAWLDSYYAFHEILGCIYYALYR